eukprot:GCRY01004476.1.p1 GENE.GCRY01004476.1~~GCRY01004476.1.p1  ORF type:complete len:209 (-),score=46.17 GCRY01004476.1:82-708(-)
MSEQQEQQQEELEVLESIWGLENRFAKESDTRFQVKIVQDELEEEEYENVQSTKWYLLNVKYTANYPDELPELSLDAFKNKSLSDVRKEHAMKIITEKATELLGAPLIFTLIEELKECWAEMFDDVLEGEEVEKKETPELTERDMEMQQKREEEMRIAAEKREKEKEEKALKNRSKSQKRRETSKLNVNGEKDRGWDWMDIIKHLSRT